MAKDNNRIIPLDDALLLNMVQEKGALVEEGRSISRQMEDVMKQVDKLSNLSNDLAAKITNKKLDIFKRVEKLTKKQLGEFEIPITTEIRDGKVVLIATDALAEFQDSFKTFDKFKEPVPRKQK
jgi:hypothetical protein